jgi:pimeloyl-ACP methyl ester carboxylesterase
MDGAYKQNIMTFNDLYFTTSSGVKLNYVKGQSNGTPIIFIPGQSATWENYKPILNLLSEKFQVFSLSIRGHGKSDWTKGDYNFNIIGNDIVEFIEHVVKRPVILVGNSSGGLISLWLGVNRPDLALGIVLEDAPLFSADYPRIKEEYVFDVLSKTSHYLNKDNPDYRGLFSVMERPLPNGQSKFLPAWLCKFLAFLITRQDNFIFHFLTQLLPKKIKRLITDLPTFDPDFSQAWVDGRIYEGLNHADALRKIKLPLLILHSNWYRTKKGLIGAMDDNDAKMAQELAPHAKYLRINAGHGIHTGKPNEFSDIIVNFTKEINSERFL